MNYTLLAFFSLFGLIACTQPTIEIKNEKKGLLKAAYLLTENRTKRLSLDTVSAPKPQYIQLFTNSKGIRYLTFLNTYTNSIYFYNYDSLFFVKKITFNKKGKNAIEAIKGYYIKNTDSIYLYNKAQIEIVLSNSDVKIRNRISLKGDRNIKYWTLYYPQYYPQTVTPFIETPGKLLLIGQYFFSISDSLVTKFKFGSQIDFKTNKVEFKVSYPDELYGSGFNWEGGLFTQVFSELHPDGDKMIFSFPVSHDLYIARISSDTHKKVYAGSNIAGNISSIVGSPRKTTLETSLIHFLRQDLYTAIEYDKYRKVFYRFFLKSIPNATIKNRKEEKSISVIIMDQNFNYLGETEIGTGEEWYWQNSFVTEEGLNIEYIDKYPDESYLTFKIFTLKKI